jgi:hypothetical protein
MYHRRDAVNQWSRRRSLPGFKNALTWAAPASTERGIKPRLAGAGRRILEKDACTNLTVNIQSKWVNYGLCEEDFSSSFRSHIFQYGPD